MVETVIRPIAGVGPVAFEPNRVWARVEGGFLVGLWDRHDQAAAVHFVPTPPTCWRLCPMPQLAFLADDGRSALISGAIQEDGKPWLHVSVARQNRMPSYKDLTDVKATFIGRDRKAILVFAAAKDHINLHPYA